MLENKMNDDGTIYTKVLNKNLDITEWLQHIIEIARNITGNAAIHYAHCGTGQNDHWFEPYIDIGTKKHALAIVDELKNQEILAVEDYYEATDDDQIGVQVDPIMLWGVRIPGVKLSHESHIECKRCIT
jgi:hypothetical protein